METALDETVLQDGQMRLQLALNVPDLDAALDFYSKLFGTKPLKVKPGYANFAIANPPLKLVLFENPDAEPGSINHLGVETDHADTVVGAEQRIAASGLETSGIDDTICCFAEKVETWVYGPDGTRWEYYVKEADHDDVFDNVIVNHTPGSGGSGPTPCCPNPDEPASSTTQTCC